MRGYGDMALKGAGHGPQFVGEPFNQRLLAFLQAARM